MNLCFKRAHLHLQLDWFLMKKLRKIIVILICCTAINISYAQSFRSSKYKFIETKHGIGEVTWTVGSIIKYTV